LPRTHQFGALLAIVGKRSGGEDQHTRGHDSYHSYPLHRLILLAEPEGYPVRTGFGHAWGVSWRQGVDTAAGAFDLPEAGLYSNTCDNGYSPVRTHKYM